MGRLILLASLLFASVLCAGDLSGTWAFHVALGTGNGEPTILLEQNGDNLSGLYKGNLGEVKIHGTVKGDKVDIHFTAQEEVVHFDGKAEGPDKITGAAKYSTWGNGTFVADRKKK